MMAHPDTLRELLTRYEALHGRPAERQKLDDVSYTLCVSTATREIGEALAAARAHIDQTPVVPAATAVRATPAVPAASASGAPAAPPAQAGPARRSAVA
ncbi:DUF5133 domain-containing protein [Streptomyces axinellae]|jgi:hypothetical protein|uniref:DUF5133 domain-containing protein n=1 Tax=Streptomyces axinellae TaxID=552788 RepID=A0ABP6D8S3_9ACTN